MFRKENINFDWNYTPNFKENYIKNINKNDFIKVNLPHANIELPFNNFDENDFQFESCYHKDLYIDDFSDEERVYIHFKAVMSYAKVYLNGEFVGEHKGGYTPFKIDLTNYALKKQINSLVVYVDSSERDDIPPFGHVIDYLTYGGIYREVSLEYTYGVHIKDLRIKTLEVLSNNPFLDLEFNIINKIDFNGEVTFNAKLIHEGNEIDQISETVSINGSEEKVQLGKNVKDIKLWDLDNPNLYNIELTMTIDNEVVDIVNDRFGFRTVEFKREGFYLNGEKIKLRGLNRHQSFPYVGYAMPKNAQYKDAEILKYELGVNTVRLSHYPQSDHFLDRCDEIGLLVFDEIPGWQHIGNEEWKEVAKKNVEEMIKKDWNRPSIYIWGTRINESQDDHDFYKETSAIAREIEDQRAIGGVRCIKNSELLEDVYTYNDFSHTGNNKGLEDPSKVTKEKSPYLVTEYNGHMFPTKKYDNEAHRLNHALRHMNVIDASYGNDKISGAIGWCMFDYNTHKDFGSGDKICYHGVMDMFRIPKSASYVYASQQNDNPVLHVASSMNIGEYAGGFMKEVYVFTNCDEIKLYSNDEFVKSFYPNKKKYPNVVNAPIIIDDFIGERIHKNESFSHKDGETVKELLIKANRTGGVLSIIDKVKLVKIFVKYKMNFLDAEYLYTKYFGGWGGKATTYKIEGFRDGEMITTTLKGQVFKPELNVSVDSNKLIEEETYDVTRIIVTLKDEYGNDINYSNEAFTIETSEHLEVIGPKVLSLIGGSVGFWVKTTGLKGNAWVHVNSPRYGSFNEEFEVDIKRT